VTYHATRRSSRARHCGALLACIMTSCQLMVGSDIDRVECEQEGVVGPPACREGESCQQGVCRPCLTQERCGDGLDNDCDGAIDDGCDPDSGSGAAAAAGGMTGDEPLGGSSGIGGEHGGGESGTAGSAGSLAGAAGSLAGTSGQSANQSGAGGFAGEAGGSGFGFGGAGQSGSAGASGARNRGQHP
jgi:hypothetical protein